MTAVSSPQEAARPAGRGQGQVLVLIEGLDCSGKSTVLSMVASHLAAAGHTVREIDGGTLAPGAVNRWYLWACRDRRYDLFRRLAYRSCVLVDRLTFRRRGPDFVLQHSYVHRQLAFEIVTGRHVGQAWSRAMARIAVVPDVRILLTVALAERIDRYQQRGFRTWRKDQRFGTAEGLAYLDAMDKVLKRLAGKAGYLVLDTSGQTPEETSAIVLAEIERRVSGRGL